MANEGSYPENARGLAMNGAEVVYRAHSRTERATRSRCRPAPGRWTTTYVIAPNLGTYDLRWTRTRRSTRSAGRSLIADHQGRVVGELSYSGGSSSVTGTIDINALQRLQSNARWGNWMKDLTTEQYRLIYGYQVYPKNLYLDRAPYTHERIPREGARGADPQTPSSAAPTRRRPMSKQRSSATRPAVGRSAPTLVDEELGEGGRRGELPLGLDEPALRAGGSDQRDEPLL